VEGVTKLCEPENAGTVVAQGFGVNRPGHDDMLPSEEFRWEVRGEAVQACKAKWSEPVQDMVGSSNVRP